MLKKLFILFSSHHYINIIIPWNKSFMPNGT